MPGFELVTLKTGVISLRSTENLEIFHPVTGPKIEANVLHVAQQRLKERAAEARGKFVIWDVGLGAAANAIAAVEAIEGSSAHVEIHSFDKTIAPIQFALSHSAELDYLHRHQGGVFRLLSEKRIDLSERIRWSLHIGDFRELIEDLSIPSPHAVIYDPYSPVTNPEMWALDHFANLFRRLDHEAPCLLTNYTRSTSVRVTLLLSGFCVGIGSAVGEKSETTVASNQIGMLKRPLRREWLDRVRVSGNSAPMTGTEYSQGRISPADFSRLERLPQFRI